MAESFLGGAFPQLAVIVSRVCLLSQSLCDTFAGDFCVPMFPFNVSIAKSEAVVGFSAVMSWGEGI